MNEVTREEIQAMVDEYALLPEHSQRLGRYVDELIRLEGRCRHAEANNAQLARHRRTDDMDAKAVALVDSLRETIARQDEAIANLKKELQKAYRENERRNREMDALHYVWCDGGCSTGAHRYDEQPGLVTAEVVETAQRNTKRLVSWFHNYQHREKMGWNRR